MGNADRQRDDMESTGDEGAANRAKLLARLVNDVRAARAAGKSADDELIISAHPELMPELREELQKLAKPQVGRSTRVARSDSFPMDPSALDCRDLMRRWIMRRQPMCHRSKCPATTC